MVSVVGFALYDAWIVVGAGIDTAKLCGCLLLELVQLEEVCLRMIRSKMG